MYGISLHPIRNFKLKNLKRGGHGAHRPESARSSAGLRDRCVECFFGICLFAAPFWSSAAELPAPIAAALQQADIPEADFALYVQDVTQDAPIISHQAERAMNPASVIKLVTTYAALEALGPAYQWRTEMYTTGTRKGDQLRGDLYIKGFGDPKINLETLWLWLRDLRNRGIRDLRGNLIIDRTWFDIIKEDPAAFDGEPLKPYNAQPDALLLNLNSHRLRFFPEVDAQRVRIAFEIDIPGTRIINQVRLSHDPCGRWKDALTYRVEQGPKGLVLHLGGSFSSECGDKAMHLALLEGNALVYALFKPLWAELGGRWRGQMFSGEVPAEAQFLTRFDSPPLAEVIRDINKFSNNVMARQLFLTLGAETLGAPATQAKATEAIHHILATRQLNFLEMAIENGSGLSRDVRISAQHMGAVLRRAFHSPYFSELESSLPIVSVDGTMSRRLKDSPVAGHAHIKTGSLNGVRTMAGYVYDVHDRRRVVVSYINHPNSDRGRPVQDAILAWVHAGAPR